MGEKLVKYYDWLQQQGGLPMKMRLAMKTNFPSAKASMVSDTPDILNKFHAACKEIAGKEPPRF
jgi:hypothetical protein